MNIDTGELRLIKNGGIIPEGFTEVPECLEEDARKAFKEQKARMAQMARENEEPVMINLNEDSPLANWAISERRRRACKNRRRMQKASKRRNRK